MDIKKGKYMPVDSRKSNELFRRLQNIFEFEDGSTNIDSQYANNKSASTGEDIKCPMCGTIFTKKQYSQAFCCTQCKDDYWNLKGGKKEPFEVKYSSNVVETQLKEVLGR